MPAVCRPLPARRFLQNRFVYCVVSQRSGGLSVGINMNPDKACNFDCVYCEVDRTHQKRTARVNVGVMIAELERMLETIHSGDLAALGYAATPPELLPFKGVALSGDGEPTLCPNFLRILEAVIHLRARHRFPFFKLTLITNATGLLLPEVRAGLKRFGSPDEVWAKLDAGTQRYMNRVNAPDVPLETVLRNIREFARRQPIVIQSLFPMIGGREPPAAEILALARRLRKLKEQGAKIARVQVYSAHRPAIDAACAHLPLRSLSRIAQTIREVSGLDAEVF